MHHVDQDLNHAAELSERQSAAEAAPAGAPAPAPSVPPSSHIPWFLDAPRFVAATDPAESGFVLKPAPEQTPDWSARIADCFGVPSRAALSLLARLRAHLAAGGTPSIHALNNALAAVHAHAPRSMIEAELVVAAVIAAHEADRQLLSGQQGGHLPTLLERSRLGQKFLGLQLQALDRLMRVRGLCGHQTIIVQHIAVNASTVTLPDANG